MLTLAFGRAIGLVFLFYATECLAMTIRYRDNETFGRRFVDNSQTNIQICGSQLTSLITWLCDGYLSSPSEDYANQNGTRNVGLDHNGVVDKCCKNPCNREFLLQHCAEKSRLKAMLQPKWETPESTNDLSNFIKKTANPPLEEEAQSAGTRATAEMRKNDSTKRKNVPPQEVGTIKPDILGGEPFIVGSRHGSSRKISSNYISRAKSIVAKY